MNPLAAVAMIIARASIFVAGVALAAILVLVAAQIGMRVFTGNSLSWSDELARICFIYLVFIGAAEASARHIHIAINLKDTFGLAGRVDRLLDLIRLVLCFAVLGVIAWGAWQIIPVVKGMQLPATRISTAWMYVPVLAGCILMMLATALNFFAIILHRTLFSDTESETGLG